MEIKSNEKIRVRLESFNHELLNTSCQKIIEITQNNNINNIGVVSLPTDKRIYCVLRSPHVNKDSREHFEIRIHKRILEIYYDSSTNIFDLLVKSDLPPGVLYKLIVCNIVTSTKVTILHTISYEFSHSDFLLVSYLLKKFLTGDGGT
jgi:small subunit ribosomal protein S10